MLWLNFSRNKGLNGKCSVYLWLSLLACEPRRGHRRTEERRNLQQGSICNWALRSTPALVAVVSSVVLRGVDWRGWLVVRRIDILQRVRTSDR